MNDLSREKKFFLQCVRGEKANNVSPDGLVEKCAGPASHAAGSPQRGYPSHQHGCHPHIFQQGPDINWISLANLVEEHACEALFYGWLKQSPEVMEKIPSDFLIGLQKKYYETGARNGLRKEMLKEILRCFHSLHIPVILHKGILVMDQLYRNMAMRPMGDVDLVVSLKDLPRAEISLTSSGFRKDAAGEAWHKKALSIDLHTDIINTLRFNAMQEKTSLRMSRMWERVRPVDFEGFSVFALSLEDQLIALCVHLAFHHRLQGWIRFADLSRFLKQYQEELNWYLLVRLAKEYENSKSVFYCLKFMSEKLEVAIPSAVLEALTPTKCGLLEKQLLRRIWMEKPLDKINYFFSLSLIENQTMRRRYLWKTICRDRRILLAI